MSICYSSASMPANVQPSALLAQRSSSTMEWGFCSGRWQTRLSVEHLARPTVLATPTCWRLDSWRLTGETNGQLAISLCPDVAVRQLSNEARLDNFDAATLLGQCTAHGAVGDEWARVLARRHGLSRLVYRQSHDKLRTRQQQTNERNCCDVLLAAYIAYMYNSIHHHHHQLSLIKHSWQAQQCVQCKKAKRDRQQNWCGR